MTTTAPDSSAAAPAARAQSAPVEPLELPAEDRAANLLDLIHRSVVANGPREALRWKLARTRRMTGGEAETDAEATWRSTTYKETWEWIRDVALGLKSLGVGKGDRVCILSRTRPAWLVADLASMSLGAVSCPIYPSSEANQAAFISNNVGAKLVFAENAQQAAKIESIRAECPTVETVVVFDERGKLPDGTVGFDSIFDLAPSDPGHRRLWDEEWRTLTRDDLANPVWDGALS